MPAGHGYAGEAVGESTWAALEAWLGAPVDGLVEVEPVTLGKGWTSFSIQKQMYKRNLLHRLNRTPYKVFL